MTGLRDIHIDLGAKRQALQMLQNGMFVMTSGSGSRHYAATVTWVSQASFKPLLITSGVYKLMWDIAKSDIGR